MRKAARLAAPLAFCALLCVSVQAQVLYKWVDDQGRTQYSDQPPKNFKGEVTRIEPPEPVATPGPAAPVAAAPHPATPGAVAPEAEEAKPDLATRRRAIRSALGARLAAAHAKVDAARKALAEVSEPEPDERQIVQRRLEAGQGGMHGQSQQRSNCRPAKDANGKGITICPVSTPNEKYQERVASLEAAVKSAEDELEEAREAWRRGVD